MQKHKLLSRKKNRKSWKGFEMICINDDIKPQTKTFWKEGKRNTESIHVTRKCFQTYRIL